MRRWLFVACAAAAVSAAGHAAGLRPEAAAWEFAGDGWTARVETLRGLSPARAAAFTRLAYDGLEPAAYAEKRREAFLGGEFGEYALRRSVLEAAADCVVMEDYEEGFVDRAAHGIYATRFDVIDLAGERVLGLDDLIRPDRAPAVETLLTKNLRERLGLAAGVDLSAAGYTDGPIWPPDSVAVTSQSVIFYWNVYTIAPYALGPTRVDLSHAALDGCLTEGAARLAAALREAR